MRGRASAALKNTGQRDRWRRGSDAMGGVDAVATLLAYGREEDDSIRRDIKDEGHNRRSVAGKSHEALRGGRKIGAHGHQGRPAGCSLQLASGAGGGCYIRRQAGGEREDGN